MLPATVILLALCCVQSLVRGDKPSRKCAIMKDRLDCKEKGLARVPNVQNLDKFSKMDLSHNKMTQLKSKAFEKFTNLTTLNLSQNIIVDIKDEAFAGLSKLRVLDLSGNQLTKFDLRHLAPLVSLKTLVIHNNKFHCDCGFESLVKLIKKTRKRGSKYNIPKVDQIKCVGPDLVKGKSLVSLNKQLLCDVNECETSSHECSKFARCINTGGSYKCVCEKGFTGNGKKCRDVNECAAVYPHKCDPRRAFCANTDGSYKCFCRNGFEKKSGRCRDVNECTAGLHKCGSHAVCSNNVGSYRCACQDGYHGDGYTCVKSKAVEQSGMHPRCIAFVIGVIVVCSILLLSACCWRKRKRQQEERDKELKSSISIQEFSHFEKFLQERVLAAELFLSDDAEKGDRRRENVVYERENKVGKKSSKGREDGCSRPTLPEGDGNKRGVFAKKSPNWFGGGSNGGSSDESSDGSSDETNENDELSDDRVRNAVGQRKTQALS